MLNIKTMKRIYPRCFTNAKDTFNFIIILIWLVLQLIKLVT